MHFGEGETHGCRIANEGRWALGSGKKKAFVGTLPSSILIFWPVPRTQWPSQHQRCRALVKSAAISAFEGFWNVMSVDFLAAAT
jgi:hypothetical protein